MGLFGKLGDMVLARLAPKVRADAACIYLNTTCGGCNQAEHVKRCCRNYDNCAQSCFYTSC